MSKSRGTFITRISALYPLGIGFGRTNYSFCFKISLSVCDFMKRLILSTVTHGAPIVSGVDSLRNINYINYKFVTVTNSTPNELMT